MENRAYAMAAGLFTLLLGTGVVLAALWFSGNTVQTQGFLLVSRYPISGLNLQAPVRYRGVTVGKVVGIKFDPQDARAILVEISVQSGTPLTKGTYAQLGSQGVTGLSYVILDDDGNKPGLLSAEDDTPARIEVRPSFMDSISTSGQDMINNFSLVAKRVNKLLSDENQNQLVSTLRNLDLASSKVMSLAAAMEPTVKALPALVNDGGVVLKRADTLLANLDRRMDSFERAARSADALFANFNQRVDSFDRAARSTEQLGNSGVALSETMTSESLPRLNSLLEDLQRSSRGLERLLYEINEQPHSLVFGRNPLPPGPGEPGFGTQGGRK